MSRLIGNETLMLLQFAIAGCSESKLLSNNVLKGRKGNILGLKFISINPNTLGKKKFGNELFYLFIFQ